MNEKKRVVEMTADEAAQFEAFRVRRNVELAREMAKAERDMYRQLVDDEVEATIPHLQMLSYCIGQSKKKVMENFRCVLAMKGEVIGAPRDDQRSHTFTNSAGDKRVTLGVYVTDGYRDTVEDGISIVKEYIEGLANDAKTKSLVGMVLKLLSRDAKGTLKASRIVQLRKVAEESGSDRFMMGVQIIEEAYQPAISKQFVRAEVKDDRGAWVSIPLGMTEAACD